MPDLPTVCTVCCHVIGAKEPVLDVYLTARVCPGEPSYFQVAAHVCRECWSKPNSIARFVRDGSLVTRMPSLARDAWIKSGGKRVL
jgi:hypothetical protein